MVAAKEVEGITREQIVADAMQYIVKPVQDDEISIPIMAEMMDISWNRAKIIVKKMIDDGKLVAVDDPRVSDEGKPVTAYAYTKKPPP